MADRLAQLLQHARETGFDLPNLRVSDGMIAHGVSAQTIYRWIRDGRLECTRNPAGRIRFTARQLLACCDSIPADTPTNTDAPADVADRCREALR